jgi:hypothetical protein
MLIRNKVYKKDDLFGPSLRNKLALDNPNNPLHQFLDGNEDRAIDILLNTFPNDRLPTSSDWCTDWYLSESPDGAGLVPCPERNRIHSGGDFLFITRLILEREFSITGNKN